MNEEQLLKELEARGLLAEEALTKLRREALLANKPVEALIHERRLVSDEKMAEVKSKLVGIPYEKVEFASFDNDLLGLIPEETVRTYGVVPLGKKEGMLIAGMLHPEDTKAQEALKFIARENRVDLGVYLISYGDWQEIIRRYSPYRTGVEAAIKSLKLKPGDNRRIARLDEEAASGDVDAPIIKIVTETFKEAVQSRASDVHIEPEENYVRIRFRVDGDLREAAALPVELAQPIVARVKVISNLKIDESRVPQDGRFRALVFDRQIDFRVSTFPTPRGEKVAIRILDSTTGLKGFDSLGLMGNNLAIVKRGLEKPFGMILVSGPTGSGKTTTLYSLLQTLNKENVNIVSLEDPVEYFVPGVNQSQVRPEIGYDFASGLREIVRQDPDVIMVGEIRDNETAGLAIQAALTGHIVLSTIHTNNAAGVIPRLIDMKVEPFLLPASLNLMVAQRLVGLLCTSCKKGEPAPEAMQKLIKKTLAGLPADLAGSYAEPYTIYHSTGCAVCKGRGVVGRIALFEVFQMTPELGEIMSSGASEPKIVAEAKRQGMMTLRQDGVVKALRGQVSLEEVLRETEEL